MQRLGQAEKEPAMAETRQKRTLFLVLYLVFALLPIYWMVNMSFKTNEEILSGFSSGPRFTWANYATIFTDESWYSGYINSLIYVAITVISITLPAAYAFSRYSFLGDKHVFFWLLTNRMTPPAVFLLPFFQLYTTLGLMDTHIAVALAHLLFNVPLAVWIWKASCRASRARSTRPPTSTATASRASS
jgi:glycerol transport system permease protein